MNLLILAQDGGSSGSPLGLYLPLILIAVFVYFVMIRPQRKRQQEFKEMQSDLSVGDVVHTIGGLVGVVDEIDDEFVELLVTQEADFALRFKRSAIAEIIRDTDDQGVDDVDTEGADEVNDEATS